MRHRKIKKTPGSTNKHRKSLLSNLATSLILHEKIETTVAKAKVLRPYIERIITSSKTNTLASRRTAILKLSHKNAVKKLFEVVAPKYQERKGGYTRIRRTKIRSGDGAELAQISLVGFEQDKS
jgi:large subunit ribosomal protein L17